jgi:exodeoxyribonuclease V alpha subunit
VLVTANDYGLGVFNGDVGVTVRRPDGGLRVCIDGSAGRIDLAPSRLGDVETLHAMTIHKAQGSQASEITVLLPGEESRLLTRELFYTAVTRAQEHVRVVGTEAAVREAVARRAARATGLRQRLTDA